MFFRGSRYEHIRDAELMTREGRLIRYKRRRFIPESTGSLAYVVKEGDRPDLAAYAALGDPEQFWRLCDVNRVQRPAELTRVPGARIRAPGPQGS
jgi:hypothetical protein